MPKFSELNKVTEISESYSDYFLINVANAEDEGETFSTKQISVDDLKDNFRNDIIGNGVPVKYDTSGSMGLYYGDGSTIAIDQLIDGDFIVREALDDAGLISYNGSLHSGTLSIPYSVLSDIPDNSNDILGTLEDEGIIETDNRGNWVLTSGVAEEALFTALDGANGGGSGSYPFIPAGDIIGLPSIPSIVTYDSTSNSLSSENGHTIIGDTSELLYYDSNSQEIKTSNETVLELEDLNGILYYDSTNNAIIDSTNNPILNLETVISYYSAVNTLIDATGATILELNGIMSYDSTNNVIINNDTQQTILDLDSMISLTSSNGVPQLAMNGSVIIDQIDHIPYYDNAYNLYMGQATYNFSDFVCLDSDTLQTLDGSFILNPGTLITMFISEPTVVFEEPSTHYTCTLPQYINTPDGVFDIINGSFVNNP